MRFVPALALLIFLLLVWSEGAHLGVAGAVGAVVGVAFLVWRLERRRL